MLSAEEDKDRPRWRTSLWLGSGVFTVGCGGVRGATVEGPQLLALGTEWLEHLLP